jgi:hypothetical protein
VDRGDRHDLVLRAASGYVSQGWFIAGIDERGVALIRPKRFNVLWLLLLGPLYILAWLAMRDRWLFLSVTDWGELVVRYG